MAALAAVLASALGLGSLMDLVPAATAASTSALVVAASIAALALLAASANLALAASFSSCVKSVRASISLALSETAWSMAALAAFLASAVGLKPLIALDAAWLAASTSELVLAASMAALALSAS